MKAPSFLVSAILVSVVAGLNYLLNHVGSFGIPDLYAPLVALAISTVIRMVQERMPAQTDVAMSPRGIDVQPQPGYWSRVFYAEPRGWSWSG